MIENNTKLKKSNKNTPEILNTQKEVAKYLKKSLRTVQYWIKGGMPVTPDGHYNKKDLQDWVTARKKIQEGKNKYTRNDKKWESFFREIKAKNAELDYKKKLGELIPREEVVEDFVQRVIVLKRSLLMLPRTLPPQLKHLEARQIRIILLTRVREMINDFARSKYV